jgi:multicomponent Na+:H+ antiporter subunit D
MTKIWGEAFWKPEPESEQPVSNPDMKNKPGADFWMHAPIVALVVLTLAMGFFPAPFVSIAGQAANELLNPEIYVNAVTGGAR